MQTEINFDQMYEHLSVSLGLAYCIRQLNLNGGKGRSKSNGFSLLYPSYLCCSKICITRNTQVCFLDRDYSSFLVRTSLNKNHLLWIGMLWLSNFTFTLFDNDNDISEFVSFCHCEGLGTPGRIDDNNNDNNNNRLRCGCTCC